MEVIKISKYLNIEKIDVEKIVKELFDFNNLGALSIQDVLTQNAKKELLEGIYSAKPLFWQVPRDIGGKVIQEMQTIYVERVTNRIGEFPLFKESIDKLFEEYSQLYLQIAKEAKFNENKCNSIGIHHYPVGSVGITPHQDYKQDLNLIASFVVEGDAPFFVCANRKKDFAKKINSSPGSVIFMRAARCEEEQQARPFHYLVGPMKKDRYAILLRSRAKDKINKLEYNKNESS